MRGHGFSKHQAYGLFFRLSGDLCRDAAHTYLNRDAWQIKLRLHGYALLCRHMREEKLQGECEGDEDFFHDQTFQLYRYEDESVFD